MKLNGNDLENYPKIILYLIGFFIFSIILWLLGIVNTNLIELSGYFSIVLGISMVLISFGNNKGVVLFFGTIIFFLGLVFFILNNFNFYQADKIIIPSFIFVIGTGFFILFLDDFSKKKNLFFSFLFWLIGIIYVSFSGEFSFTQFFSAIKDVTYSFWMVILLVFGVYLLLNNYSKK